MYILLFIFENFDLGKKSGRWGLIVQRGKPDRKRRLFNVPVKG